jgi:IS5 family transposase
MTKMNALHFRKQNYRNNAHWFRQKEDNKDYYLNLYQILYGNHCHYRYQIHVMVHRYPQLTKILFYGQDTFNEFSELIMSLSLNPSSTQKGDEQPSNQGKLKIDATVADQYIRYPNDLSLVNEARLKSEKIIDQLYILLKDEFPVKPRTYRKVAHQRYLQEAKKKQKSAKSVRKAIRYLLNCVERNLRYIDAMLDKFHGVEFPLANKYQKRLWVIHTLYDQQRKMYDEKSHTCTDRIVSISQPHVRPIVRGKQGKPVEFGSKLGLSLIDGYMIHETLSWEAYNESKDLQKQAETYKLLLGYYPELIQADKIYATNENRIWCKERNIRLTATPKGRPAKKTAAQIRKEKKEYAERNHIEGRIGNAKQSFSLNQIKAKLKETSSTWIAVTIFVMNLSRFANLLNTTF